MRERSQDDEWLISARGIEMFLFKYGRREHCEAFFEDGTVQIGALRAYDTSTHGEKIGDDDEGRSRTSVYKQTDGLRPPNGNALAPLEEWDYAPGSSGNVWLVDNETPNYAIYSTSMIIHRELCLDFSPSYGAAIAIKRPFPFFHELTNAMAASGRFENVTFHTVDNVEYRSKELEHGEVINEALTKTPNYQHQAEWRAIWNAGELAENFYLIKTPLARRHCELVLLEQMPDYPSGNPPAEIAEHWWRPLQWR